jgi:hypothetical protein
VGDQRPRRGRRTVRQLQHPAARPQRLHVGDAGDRPSDPVRRQGRRRGRAAKLGLFAALGKLLAKLWKLVIIGIAGLGAAIKRLFSKGETYSTS